MTEWLWFLFAISNVASLCIGWLVGNYLLPVAREEAGR